MSAQPNPYRMNQEIERELAQRIDIAEAENKPAEVEIAGNRYCLVLVDDIQTTDDPAPNYDPHKAPARIRGSHGANHGGNSNA